MPGARVAIRLRSVKDVSQRAWMTMHVVPRDDQQVRFKAEIDEALAADPVSFMHPIPPAQARILKNEIIGGILTAKRQAKIGCTIELVSIGGASAEQRSVSALPSIAYAVAATLAVLQGLGIEDLRTAPRGGYGWELDEVVVEALT
jgi:hypothetical protein